MEIDKKLLKAMPKTDLHVHLDGSVRIPTLLDLAKKQKVESTSVVKLLAY